MKKLLCLSLLILTVVALVACGTDEPVKDTYYTVTYDTDGGSAVNPNSVKENDKLLEPVAPTKNGYDFAGWYVGESAYNFENAVTTDLSLKAKWTKTTYTITFMDGENVLELAPATYDIETATFALPEPTKVNYTFMGWFTDTAFTQSAHEVEKGTYGNLVFYANFTLKNYGITYVLYDGENSDGNPSTYNLNSTFPITLANPTKEGYEFLGWYADANYTGSAITAITEIAGNITVYAKWEKIEDTKPECVHVDTDDDLKCDECGEDYDDGVDVQPEPETEYTITYMDGDVILTLEPGVYEVGVETALPLTAKDHFTFLGWYTTATFDEGTKIEAISTTTTGNLVLYARFAPVEYTITYVLAGGTNADENPATYTVLDGNFVFANPTKEGHNFAGWYTDPFFKTNVSTLNGKTGDLVLYAQWKQEGSSGILTPEDTFGD